ncbi:MAG TPA: hypothetical protein PLS94_10335 [Prolixibacteraceae bacterium]|nr:hypothetical protein [Prolixibacteraceae bacterium]HPR60972.1 hypothetical protein [Prolixibacteraceae bacterium]
MTNKSDIDNNNESFEYRLKEVSDDEIISILRYREHFKQQAVKDAIREAFKRGIISDIEDLNKPEFMPQELQTRSLFPLGATKPYTFAIFKSLCRIFYGFSLIPVLFGILQLTSRNFFEGALAIIVGAIVFYIVNRLEKKLLPIYANILLFMNIPAFVVAFFFLNYRANSSIMDIFSIIVVLLILLYTSLYLKKLTNYFNS